MRLFAPVFVAAKSKHVVNAGDGQTFKERKEAARARLQSHHALSIQ